MTNLQFDRVPVAEVKRTAAEPNPFDEPFKPVDGKILTDAPDGDALRFTLPYNTEAEVKAVGVMERLARAAAKEVDRSAKINKEESPVKDSKGKVTGKNITLTVYTVPKITRARKPAENAAPAETPAETPSA